MGQKCILSKFTDDTKVEGVVHAPDGYTAIQRDINKMAS